MFLVDDLVRRGEYVLGSGCFRERVALVVADFETLLLVDLFMELAVDLVEVLEVDLEVEGSEAGLEVDLLRRGAPSEGRLWKPLGDIGCERVRILAIGKSSCNSEVGWLRVAELFKQTLAQEQI